MFYDANRLLCNNVTAPNTANFATDFKAKINEKQNVSAFCSEALHFTVPSTSYLRMLNLVFQHADGCKRVCTDDDISTGDTNFFCKYYKWSLSQLQVPQSSIQGSVPVSAGSGSPGDLHNNNATTTQIVQKSDVQVKKTSDTVNTNTQLVKVEEPSQHTSEVAKQESSSPTQLSGSQNPDIPSLPSNVDNNKKSTLKPDVKQDTADKVGDAEPGDTALDPNDAGNEAGIENNAGNIKDPDAMQQLETPNHKIVLDNEDTDDTGMDMDDEGKDASDDGDDPIVGDLDVKQEPEASSHKRVESQVPLNGDVAQRDFFQNADGFTEDDDHFFPFFLTAVIVVVVLYVLYHNKNKVGKMFFGLIVEGRQPGRRRNSRGHAYRRLDTLEQAMSANTPAPPSKIIY
ncbi:trans-Golgi network integral membrane protein 2-like [Leguminivora glycinivorella]|uniref:trans-Golgi network integral membrane protein 2-like n=1 Tax=Leguminivora glycinivorella TaxID=1035111 RepID=UPI00200C300F|nr:trans-Golgi network integral membrane protein 2-like [Leguminivora glycinivorella]